MSGYRRSALSNKKVSFPISLKRLAFCLITVLLRCNGRSFLHTKQHAIIAGAVWSTKMLCPKGFPAQVAANWSLAHAPGNGQNQGLEAPFRFQLKWRRFKARPAIGGMVIASYDRLRTPVPFGVAFFYRLRDF
ncbi:MAG: hypothetical protein AAF720_08520 [Pseudomonadota bacterium]